MRGLPNKPAIGSASLGLHPAHTLDRKIAAAAKHGFLGMEIVYQELQAYSEQHDLSIETAAENIRQLCESHGIEIVSLCPFDNYEGNPSPLKQRLAKAAHWFDIARILHAPYMQIPSQFNHGSNSDEAVIVAELQQLADLGSSQSPIISIAYEALSWGLFCSTWETALRYVQRVDRGNFGICLDTFHEATKLWASYSEPSGKFPNADRVLADSLRRFIRDFPLDKLYYVQLSDGERFDPPFSKEHPYYLEGEAPEFSWSKHARPFPLETELGGYLPVSQILKAWVVDTGFRGWISFESFDRRMQDEAYSVETSAARAERSWQKLQQEVKPVTANL